MEEEEEEEEEGDIGNIKPRWGRERERGGEGGREMRRKREERR